MGQQEATTSKQASKGGAVWGKRSTWQPGLVHLRRGHPGAQEGKGSHIVGIDPPIKQATGITRFSYAAAVEGGEHMVQVSLDGTALTMDDPKSLGELVNKWTFDTLNRMEFHNILEILEAKPA